jgi:hypothetical protein
MGRKGRFVLNCLANRLRVIPVSLTGVSLTGLS